MKVFYPDLNFLTVEDTFTDYDVGWNKYTHLPLYLL